MGPPSGPLPHERGALIRTGTSRPYGTDDPAKEPSFLNLARLDAEDPAAAGARFAEDMIRLAEAAIGDL